MAQPQAWRRGFNVSIVLALLLGLVTLLLALPSLNRAGTSGQPEATPTATPSATGTPAPSAVCEARFVQEPDAHGDDGKVDAGFTAAYNKKTAGKSGADLAVAQREVLLERAGVNAKRLASWAYANGLHKDPNDWKGLVSADGKCLSTAGMMLHSKLEGAFNGKGVNFSEAEAPNSGYNSGVDNGSFVVAERPGIVSDPKAILITYPNGTKVYVLVYCGNVIFPAPPAGVPTSPKIPQPEKPVPPVIPPPVTDCTATPTLPECLAPKTGDWIAPTPGGDGTTDSEGQWQQYGPGEFTGSTPPKVVTQQPGASSGGTVVDSATKAPSSETGGKAPGSTQEVKPSKPAETGANDPTVQNPDQPEVGGNDGHIDNPFG
ncbi:hypothetical protein D3C85_626930 [compost metagenome]